MFLVDNGQSKVLELHTILDERMGTNDNIYGARSEPIHDKRLFFLRLEPGYGIHNDGPVCESVLKCFRMLLR